MIYTFLLYSTMSLLLYAMYEIRNYFFSIDCDKLKEDKYYN